LFYVGTTSEKGKEGTGMSEEGDTFWLSLAEKFFGLLLVIIGALFLYFTLTSTTALGVFTGLFGFLSIVVLIIGLFLLFVRPPE
jgi:membrane-bound ClpP family serine protease